jgi:hypothetical protein
MEIKNYDDMIVVECSNKDKFGPLFTPLMHKGSKWIQISGKNFFATTIDNYTHLKMIVENIQKTDDAVDKYNSIDLKLKEEYYKSFDCRPLHFSAELRRRSRKSSKSLSSSVYDDETSSSDGFPSPGTPGKKRTQDDDDDDDDSHSDLEYIINKINELEDRIDKLEDHLTS